jgi:uncharacterized BrkB/YihY/UPF0761 family membrane protein
MRRTQEHTEHGPAFAALALTLTWERMRDCLVVLGCLLCEGYLYVAHRFWQEQLLPSFQGTPNVTRIVLGAAPVWHVGFVLLTLVYLAARRSAPNKRWTTFAAVLALFLMLIFCIAVGMALALVMPITLRLSE